MTDSLPTPHTRSPLPLPETADQLRARIPGWGVDLDPRDRPSTPRLDPSLDLTGPHGEVPERQFERRPRERSIEHGVLPPVFGTAQPPQGVSGALRRLSYARYSEARAAHWLLLIAADRVDAVGSHLLSLLSLRPDDPVTETGVRAELTRNGAGSRLGRHRADTVHHLLDPVLVLGPWLVAAGLGLKAARYVARTARG